MKKLLQILLFYAVIPMVVGLLYLVVIFIPLPPWAGMIQVPALTVLFYYLIRRKLNLRFAARANGGILVFLALCFLCAMIIGDGSLGGPAVRNGFEMLVLPFFGPILILHLSGYVEYIPCIVLLTYAAAMVTCLCLAKSEEAPEDATPAPKTAVFPKHQKIRLLVITGVIVLACGAASFHLYKHRPEVRYGGHGFDYMHGFSSTDFHDYLVYSEPSRLVQLDHQPDLVIAEEKDMPVMDGAEACYPLYAALAKATYKDIATIEKEAGQVEKGYPNGKIVTFTNTIYGFRRLLDKEVDLFFGARPSEEQMNDAQEMSIELEITTIGREGFVFFVEADNPVNDLTSEQIRAIYHGDITNWSEVGGKDQEISAFQRPANSGSQTMMEYFMGDVPLKEPKTYETVDSMVGVVQHVAQYANEAGAMGYSFRYFVEGLNQEKGVKLLSVDGVAPTQENIENGSYPLTVSLCLITRKDDPNPYVQRMIDFILSADGQEIVRKTGYAGVE